MGHSWRAGPSGPSILVVQNNPADTFLTIEAFKATGLTNRSVKEATFIENLDSSFPSQYPRFSSGQ